MYDELGMIHIQLGTVYIIGNVTGYEIIIKRTYDYDDNVVIGVFKAQKIHVIEKYESF